jgi:SAM-dependent methyltransferase
MTTDDTMARAMDRDDALEKVSGFWAWSQERRSQLPQIAWSAHRHSLRHINRRVTGDASLDWLTYVLRKYFPAPAARAFTLACGPGNLERHALSTGAVQRFDACDASEGAVQDARTAAAAQGVLERIDYRVADVDRLTLPAGTYDAVFASMSVHHFTALEHVFGQVRQALVPGGLFILNEYIGPSRFQYSADVVGLIDGLLQVVPERYRRVIRDGRVTDEIKTAYALLPLSHFEVHDPSEAVRSAEIVPLLAEHFRILECRPYGGTLLTFLHENIIGNFDDDQAEDRAWLDMLAHVEMLLEESGRIDSSYAMIVAAPA